MSNYKNKIQNITSNNLAISLFWGTFAGIASQGLNFVTNILLARYLAVDYGELVLYVTTNSMLQTFGLFGLNILATVFVAKYINSDEVELSKLIPHMYYIVVSLSLIVGLISVLINVLKVNSFQFWRFESYYTLIPTLIWYVTSTIDTLQISILSGFGAFKDLAKASIVKGIISIVIISTFMYFWNVEGVIFGYAISFSISLIFNYLFIRKNSECLKIKYTILFDFNLIKKIVVKSFPVFLAALVIAPAQWGVNYIIYSKPEGGLALAIFGVVNQWMILIQFFPLQVSKVVLPFLTNQKGKFYLRTEKIGLYLSLFIAFVLISCSLLFEKQILALYDFSFSYSSIPFKIMLIASFFSILNMFYGQTIIANEKAWGRLIADLFISISLVLSFMMLVKYSIILSLPLSYCLSYIIGFVVVVIYKKKYIYAQ